MTGVRVGITVGSSMTTPIRYREVLEHLGMEVRVLSSVEVHGDWDVAARGALADLHGVVMAGGGDIDPDLLGGAAADHPAVYGIETHRDLWERAVFDEAWRRDVPIFAICRGMQVMNWALGGTLCPDLDDLHAPHGVEKRHRQTDYGHGRFEPTHPIRIAPDSRFLEIVGTEHVHVNSLHHQAVCELAPGLRATAWADDGVVEAMEHPGRAFAFAVQFHPEEMWRQDERFQRLFEAFCDAAARFRKRAE